MKKPNRELMLASSRSFRIWIAVIFLLIIFNSTALFVIGSVVGNIYNEEFQVFLDLVNPKFYVHYSIFILVAAFLIALVVTLGFIHTQLRPFHLLMNGMKQLKRGDFDTRVEIKGHTTREFRELSENFNALAKELSSTELLQKDFINNFSHEFKSPIMSIRGFAKILKSDSLSQGERDEYLDIIIHQSQRLSKLSSNVLTLCKIENQTIPQNLTTFCLSEQIRLNVLMLEPEWSKKKLNLDIQVEDMDFFGNKELCDHIWSNLIGNAIKFSQQNQDLVIGLTQDRESVIFSVTDYGEGMSAETQKRIFDQFYQGDTTHASGGNGIGLSIAKLVVKQCGGTILVDSTLGVGSTFTVTLPK